jgi:7-cyano-7-deazaguanine synthase in queuosine biosynthesis
MANTEEVDYMVEHVILLSGGYESVGCLLKAMSEAIRDKLAPSQVRALFIDYGQPYLDREVAAVTKLTQVLGIVLDTHVMKLSYHLLPGENKTRVFENRNERFLVLAGKLYPGAEVWFGCRAPWDWVDPYKDSNRQFANRIEKAHGFRVVTPFILSPKFLVKRFVRKYSLDRYVFSSENYKYE